MRTGRKFAQILTFALLGYMLACCSGESYYDASDFGNVPKIDAHFHYLTMDVRYMKFAAGLRFRLLNPNWDGEEVTIDDQLSISAAIKRALPRDYAFFGTFSADSVWKEGYAAGAIRRIDSCIQLGASGVKIWKNIGMVIKSQDGRYVMIDDPVFAPVFRYLQDNKISVMGHLGEPRDCWLPVDSMIDPGAVSYFTSHPQYYMYLHPEAPSYDEQIEARDSVLGMYPSIDFIGAHLASLEWSLDEVARHLDRYPGLKVDLAARLGPVMYHSDRNRDKVREFFIKYQDRILYGTDFEVHDDPATDPEQKMLELKKGWLDQWIYFTTDSVVGARGLKLPKEVIDKIYYRNAIKYFD